MPTFVKGELWGNGSGASAILNTGFEIGQIIEVGRHDCLMRMRATITGTAPSSVDLRVEYATPQAPTVFYELPLPEDGVFDGADWVEDVLFLPLFRYRISAKRTGGDGTTALYLHGALRDNRVVEGSALTPAGGAILWIRGVLAYLYDSVAVALRVINLSGPETVRNPETLFDVTGAGIGVHSYYVEHDRFRTFTLHYIPGGAGTATLKIYEAVQDDDTPIASREYEDVTHATFGSTSFSSRQLLSDHAGLRRNAKSLLFEVTVTGDVADFTGYFKQSY